MLFSPPAFANPIRISAEDLKLRAEVSRQLAPPLRIKLEDLAATILLYPEEGEKHTEKILEDNIANPNWSKEERLLVYYYLLVARLEKANAFANEFDRRETVTQKGRDLMRAYLDDLNRLIAMDGSDPNQSFDLGPKTNFPLAKVGWEKNNGASTLFALHQYPAARAALGRKTLRSIREQALEDLNLFDVELKRVRSARGNFIKEVSILGNDLISLRPQVIDILPNSREGQPFSF